MRSGTADDAERPATFRDVLAVREFRSIYASSSLSWVGDYLARAAIAALVYDQTKSVAASAAAFAVSFAPWLLGGPVLASIAERYPYRTVMVDLRPGPRRDHGGPRAGWLCRSRQ